MKRSLFLLSLLACVALSLALPAPAAEYSDGDIYYSSYSAPENDLHGAESVGLLQLLINSKINKVRSLLSFLLPRPAPHPPRHYQYHRQQW